VSTNNEPIIDAGSGHPQFDMFTRKEREGWNRDRLMDTHEPARRWHFPATAAT